MVSRNCHPVTASKPASSLRVGSVELWHGSGRLLWADGGQLHFCPTARQKAQQCAATVAGVLLRCPRQTRRPAAAVRGRELLRWLVEVDLERVAKPTAGAR